LFRQKDIGMKFYRGILGRFSLSVLVLAVPTLAAAAQERDCFGFDGVTDDPLAMKLYQVQQGEQVEFQCPEKSLICNKGAFLLSGDQVVVSRIDGDRACAEYLNPYKKPGNDETAGWLPLSRLTRISPAPDWTGRWGDDEITISAKHQGDKIRVDARASLQFGNGEEGGQFAALIDDKQPQARFGYQFAIGKEAEKLLPYQDKETPGVCQVRMAQLGRYLVVGDNHICGGINVSFSQVYRRVDEKPPVDQATVSNRDLEQRGSYGLRYEYSDCLDKSGAAARKPQDCASPEYKYQDDRLNRAYRALRTKLDRANATQLRDEQRGWIADRDKQCPVATGDATAAPVVANDCSVQVTARRAAELESRLLR
jgi:uncharacterized protein YecT (DUF1311 family)